MDFVVVVFLCVFLEGSSEAGEEVPAQMYQGARVVETTHQGLKRFLCASGLGDGSVNVV